jgi:hypothetical protein
MTQCQFRVVNPQRIGGNIWDYDPFLLVGCGAAGTNRWPDLDAVKRANVGLRQAWGRPMAQGFLITIQE